MTSLRARGPLRGASGAVGAGRSKREVIEPLWRLVEWLEDCDALWCEGRPVNSTYYSQLSLAQRLMEGSPCFQVALTRLSLIPSFPQSLSCFTAVTGRSHRKDLPINKHTCHITWPPIQASERAISHDHWYRFQIWARTDLPKLRLNADALRGRTRNGLWQ